VASNPIKFGTDGWRAIIADDFTFANLRFCAQGVASYLEQTGLASRGLVIGYDTRFASEHFAASAAEVAAGNGIPVYLCPRPTPTPVVSYGVLAKQAAGAVIITASHNPGAWNGFKFKNEQGFSAPDEVTRQIEALVDRAFQQKLVKRMPLEKAVAQGLVAYTDLEPVYFEQLERLVDFKALRSSGLKAVIDPMYGAGAGYLKRLLAGGTASAVEIHGERNPLFPGMARPEPIAANLNQLAAKVREEKAAVGLATDGDADRMGIIDEQGNFLTQLQVFALLCLYLLETRGERGGIVKTLTTTSMANRLGELFHVPVFETPVGFKYVAPVMRQQNALIGGEESGGYGFRGHVLERDGILACLYFLDLMVRRGQTPSELLSYLYDRVGPHHYQRVDECFPAEQRPAMVSRLEQQRPEAIDGVRVSRRDAGDGWRYVLEDNSWLLIRFSGTEPVLRIYTETDSPSRAARLLEIGRRLAGISRGVVP